MDPGLSNEVWGLIEPFWTDASSNECESKDNRLIHGASKRLEFVINEQYIFYTGLSADKVIGQSN
jgi:hypothetical protein